MCSFSCTRKIQKGNQLQGLRHLTATGVSALDPCWGSAADPRYKLSSRSPWDPNPVQFYINP